MQICSPLDENLNFKNFYEPNFYFKKLPEHIILNILSYVSIHDIINLLISKIFFSTILSHRKTVDKLREHLMHTIGYSYFKNEYFLESCWGFPLFVNNDIYVLLDLEKCNKIKKKKIITIFDSIFSSFAEIFLAFEFHNKNNINGINNILWCYGNCRCQCRWFHFHKCYCMNIHTCEKSYFQKKYLHIYKKWWTC